MHHDDLIYYYDITQNQADQFLMHFEDMFGVLWHKIEPMSQLFNSFYKVAEASKGQEA